MRKFERKNKAIPKVNVIPILDAVFIFIFFLLMSAQFLEIYEIGTDAPTVKTISEQKDKKPPLNLTLKIDRKSIEITAGVPARSVASINMAQGEYDYKKLNQELSKLKQAHLEESSVILKPKEDVPYDKIVKIMDACRAPMGEDKSISAKNKQGEIVTTKKLFDQIIFETII
jgi:biopolymer transport protein ExbD